MKTSYETSWASRATRVLAGGPGTFSKSAVRYPGNGLVPETLVRGKGAYVWGDDGRRYLDLVAALGPIVLGHADPRVTAAVTRQLAQGTSFSLLHPLEVEIAEALCGLLPWDAMARFCRNGTDACAMAARLARAVTGKPHVLWVGYHGGACDSYGITTDKAAGILLQVAPYNHQAAWDVWDDAMPRHAWEDLAAIVVEVPSLPWSVGDGLVRKILQRYKTEAEHHGALFVLDEIITWPREQFDGYAGITGVMPDLWCLSKALANGLPLAALVGHRPYMERLNRGDIFCSWTFAGETTALAAAQAVLITLQETDTLERLHNAGQALGNGLQALFQHYATPVELLGTPARLALRWQEVPGVATALELRTLWLAELARRGILCGIGACFVMSCWQINDVKKVLNAAEEICYLMKCAINSNNIKEVLPCPVIQDVLSVRI